MNDLISRSELLESFRKSYRGHLGMENSDGMITFRSICRIINAQPTAYDINKVVEELEGINGLIRGRKTCSECEYITYCFYGEQLHKVAIDKAIEIVKQGAVSDDVCEYETKDDVIYTSCNNKSIASAFCWFNECGDYKYCPYCGKKIKIVDD